MQSGQTTVSIQAQVLEGCVVEVVAYRDHVQYIITTPPEASDKAGSSRHDGSGASGNNAFLPNPSRSAALNPPVSPTSQTPTPPCPVSLGPLFPELLAFLLLHLSRSLLCVLSSLQPGGLIG